MVWNYQLPLTMGFGNEIFQGNKEEDAKVKIRDDKHETVQLSYITLSVDMPKEKKC